MFTQPTVNQLKIDEKTGSLSALNCRRKKNSDQYIIIHTFKWFQRVEIINLDNFSHFIVFLIEISSTCACETGNHNQPAAKRAKEIELVKCT